MSKLKIIVLGPEKVGKTTISNTIADIPNNDYSLYESTEGVRILETDTSINFNSCQKTVEIELWDCAGSHRYQSCWPAIQLDTNGIIFVYNPAIPEQKLELELFYNYFVIQNGLNDINCMILVNPRNNMPEHSITPSDRFRGLLHRVVNVMNNPNGVKLEFSTFIQTLWKNLKT